MSQLTNPTVVRALMQKHGVRFQKGLGQNFLINPSVCPRMAGEGGARPGVGALEIGPGVGVLTAELAARCDRVVAVEVDRRLTGLLAESLGEFDNVEIVEGDVLKTDLNALLRDKFGAMPVVVCANLPYYITSPILMHLLESRLPVESYTLMMQKEVAARICAGLPAREAGALTAAVHWRCEARQLFTVSPGSFLPPPTVESAVVRLDVCGEPPAPVGSEATLFAVVRAAFSQRRKTLRNSLSSLVDGKEELPGLFARAGVDPGARAEQLDLPSFARLADALDALRAGELNKD